MEVFLYLPAQELLLLILRGKPQVSMRSDHLSPYVFVSWIAVSRAPEHNDANRRVSLAAELSC